jgi:hypothetical protein
MIEPYADGLMAITQGAGKVLDAEVFVNEPRSMRVTPRAARNISCRRSAIDGRTVVPPFQLRLEPAHKKADLKSLRLAQDGDRTAKEQVQGT